MGNFVIYRTSCPNCKKLGNDNSNDNLVTYSDGSNYCFACGYTNSRSSKKNQQTEDNTNNTIMSKGITSSNLVYLEIKEDINGISKHVLNKYNCSLVITNDSTMLAMPYVDSNHSVAKVKIRSFTSEGFNRDFKFLSVTNERQVNLFGYQLYKNQPNVIIFEGERDLLTFETLYGCPSNFCYFALPGVSNANNVAIYLQKLTKIKKLYVVFDKDDAGKLADLRFKEILGDLCVFNKNRLNKDICDSANLLPETFEEFISNFDAVISVPNVAEDSYRLYHEFVEQTNSHNAVIDISDELPTIAQSVKFRRGMLALICGDTGGGKSFFIDWLIIKALMQGKKVLLVSLEMSPGECIARLLHQLTGHYAPHKLEDTDENFKQSILNWCNCFDKQLFINTDSNPCIESIKQQLIAFGGEIDIVIVDTISLFARTLEWQALTEVSYQLKSLSMDIKVGKALVITVSQMSVKNKDINKVTISDLYAASGIAQAVDYALFVNNDKELEGTKLKVLKLDRAGGKPASTTAKFDFKSGRWTEDKLNSSNNNYDYDGNYEEDDETYL